MYLTYMLTITVYKIWIFGLNSYLRTNPSKSCVYFGNFNLLWFVSRGLFTLSKCLELSYLIKLLQVTHIYPSSSWGTTYCLECKYCWNFVVYKLSYKSYLFNAACNTKICFMDICFNVSFNSNCCCLINIFST